MTRPLWNGLGALCIGLGVLGIYVPGMPTTVFFIIALYCLGLGGNEKSRSWLLNHPRFGAALRDWEATKAIPYRIKVISVASIVVSCGISMFIIPNAIGRNATAALGIAGIVYILTRPTRENLSAVAVEDGLGRDAQRSEPTEMNRQSVSSPLPTASPTLIER